MPVPTRLFLSILPAVLLACDMGPSDVTVVEDVQIVHAGVALPAAVPGTTLEYTVTVADPTGEGVELLAWSCTGFGGVCAEDELTFDSVGDRLAVAAADQGDFAEDAVVSLAVPAEYAFLLQAGGTASDTGAGADGGGDTGAAFAPEFAVWFLACEPGLCPWIEDARGALSSGEIDADLSAFLADPTAAMNQVPAAGTALGWRRLPLTLDLAEANTNPELRLSEEVSLDVATEAETALPFQWVDELPDSIELQGFATVGALGPARTDYLEPTLTWYAPEQAGSGRLYVVARDGLGGSALWRADATVGQ